MHFNPSPPPFGKFLEKFFKREIQLNTTPLIYLNGTVLSQITSCKYLGVAITATCNLSWKPNVTSIKQGSFLHDLQESLLALASTNSTLSAILDP
jgi:hypothetical protein